MTATRRVLLWPPASANGVDALCQHCPVERVKALGRQAPPDALQVEPRLVPVIPCCQAPSYEGGIADSIVLQAM